MAIDRHALARELDDLSDRAYGAWTNVDTCARTAHRRDTFGPSPEYLRSLADDARMLAVALRQLADHMEGGAPMSDMRPLAPVPTYADGGVVAPGDDVADLHGLPHTVLSVKIDKHGVSHIVCTDGYTFDIVGDPTGKMRRYA